MKKILTAILTAIAVFSIGMVSAARTEAKAGDENLPKAAGRTVCINMGQNCHDTDGDGFCDVCGEVCRNTCSNTVSNETTDNSYGCNTTGYGHDHGHHRGGHGSHCGYN